MIKQDSWKHVTLCDKNKKIRDDWETSSRVEFKAIAKKRNATECEKNAEEIQNDIEKYFNNERNLCAKQQVLGITETFVGVVVKEWVSMIHKNINYSQHNNKLIEMGVSVYCAF